MIFTTAFAAAGLVLGQPWYGFDSEDPLLNIVRIQKVPTSDQAACEEAVKAISRLDFGMVFSGAYTQWAPWNENDLEALKDCDDFPCKMKLSKPETLKMAKTGDTKRQEAFLGLVSERAESYRKTQIRAEYEFPGNPVDPWKWFEAHGFKSSGLPPGLVSLRIRKLDLHPERLRPIRQILDVREVISKLSATVWLRDAYTAHYFDGWGEWHQIACDPLTHLVTVTQSLFVELDLMKSKNIFARFGRGKMRTGVREQGSNYLDGQFEKLGFKSELKK